MVALLADGNNIAIRSFMAPHQEMSAGDTDTGALVLFVNTLSRYVRLYRPDTGLVCWDSGKSSYRTKLFPAYKANRTQKISDQAQHPIAFIQKFLKLAGFPQLQLPGYEGDDLIGASWRACRGRERIYILSSDKDMLQLLEDGTEQIKLVRNGSKPDVWNRARFIKEHGFKPEYQAWVLALMGDASDGIPGLKKVGPKTAVKMLNSFNWDMADLIESLPNEDQETVLTNLAIIDLSYVPLDLDQPPEISLVKPGDPQWDDLAMFCDQLQLTQIKAKLEEQKLWSN